MVKSTRGTRQGRQQKRPATIDIEANKVVEETIKGAKEIKETAKSGPAAEAETSVKTKPEDTAKKEDGKSGDSANASSDAIKTKSAGSPNPDMDKDNSKTSQKSASTSDAANGNGNKPKPQAIKTPNEQGKKSGSMLGGLVAAIIGGGVALGGANALNLFGSTNNEVNSQISQEAQQAISDLQSQISQLKETGQGEAPDSAQLSSLTERITSLENALSQTSNTTGLDAIKSSADQTAARVEELAGRLDIVDKAISDAAQAGEGGGVGGAVLAQIEDRISGIEMQIGAAGKSVEEISSKVEGLATQKGAGGELQAPVFENTAAIAKNTEMLTSQAETLGKMDERLGGLESVLKETVIPQMTQVQEAAETARSGEKIARSIAARSLSGALEQGGSFSTELTSAEALVGPSAEIDALKEIAGKGIETQSNLLEQFEPVANSILTAQNAPDQNAGVFDRFMASAKSLVNVRPAGPVDGDSPPAILSRVEAALKSGNSQDAMTEWASLPEEARQQAGGWQQALENRVQAETLVEKVIQQLTTQGN